MNIKNHYSIESSEQIKNICKHPLEKLNLSYFNYVKINPNNSREVLTTNAEWLEYFYLNELYNSKAVNEVDSLLPKGYYFWNELQYQDEVYVRARNKFNIDHGITIIEKSDNETMLYIFGTTKEQRNGNEYYVRNIDLLKRFILYFHDRANNLLSACAQHRLTWSATKITGEISNARLKINDKRQEFIDLTNLHKYILITKGKKIHLTRREAESAVYLVTGHTAKETAREMGISFRTIEKFNQKVRTKIPYNNRYELELILKEAGIYQAVINDNHMGI